MEKGWGGCEEVIYRRWRKGGEGVKRGSIGGGERVGRV